jgi:hypothetical protein
MSNRVIDLYINLVLKKNMWSAIKCDINQNLLILSSSIIDFLCYINQNIMMAHLYFDILSQNKQ